MNNQNKKKNPYGMGGKPEKRTPVLAEVHITQDDPVTISREEYGELIAESTILRVVEQMVEHSTYASYTLDILRIILDIGNPDAEAPQPAEGESE